MLPLTSVNLPGGELVNQKLNIKTNNLNLIFFHLKRRRSEEDERMMRLYFIENDLISVSFF